MAVPLAVTHPLVTHGELPRLPLTIWWSQQSIWNSFGVSIIRILITEQKDVQQDEEIIYQSTQQNQILPSLRMQYHSQYLYIFIWPLNFISIYNFELWAFLKYTLF